METSAEKRQRLLSLLLNSKITRCPVINHSHCKYHAVDRDEQMCVYGLLPVTFLVECPMRKDGRAKMKGVL